MVGRGGLWYRVGEGEEEGVKGMWEDEVGGKGEKVLLLEFGVVRFLRVVVVVRVVALIVVLVVALIVALVVVVLVVALIVALVVVLVVVLVVALVVALVVVSAFLRKK